MVTSDKRSRALFYALGVSTATGGPPLVVLSLILIDVAESLNVEVGVLGQVSSFSSFISIIVAVLMGILAVRYRHKLLLSLGLGLMCVSVIGTSSSFNLVSFMVLFSLSGMGYSMVMPMVNTFVGEIYPAEGRTKVVGNMIAVRSIVSFLAPLVTGYVVSLSNWRIGYASFNLTLTVISLALVLMALPQGKVESVSNPNQLEGIRGVLRNGSAVAYLLAAALAFTPFVGIQVFNGSYLRQHFALPVRTVSQVMPLVAIAVTAGLLTSNRYVEWIGLKKTVYLSTFLSSIAFLVYFGAGLSLAPAVACSMIGSYLTGVWLASTGALSLLQETVYRGSMMSLGTAASSLGGVLGSLVGGYALIGFGYLGLGAVTGLMGLAATLIYSLWVRRE